MNVIRERILADLAAHGPSTVQSIARRVAPPNPSGRTRTAEVWRHVLRMLRAGELATDDGATFRLVEHLDPTTPLLATHPTKEHTP